MYKCTMGLNLTKLVWFLKIKYNVIFTNVIFHIIQKYINIFDRNTFCHMIYYT